MRTLNAWLAISLIAGGLVLSGGVYLLHDYQVRRHARAFFDAARRAKDKRQYKDAKQNYRWYVNLAHGTPGAAEALYELATLTADEAPAPGSLAALPIYEELFREDPSRLEARRRVVAIAMSARNQAYFGIARDHIQFLLHNSRPDGALFDQLGRCEMALRHDKAAEDAFREAIRLAPGELDAYADLAALLRRRMERPSEADQLIKEMMAKNPNSAKAHTLYGKYLYQEVNGGASKASEEAEKALKLAPHDREALWLAAQCALTLQDAAKALEITKVSEKYYKNDPMVYLTEARINLFAGKREEALATLRRGLVATKNHPEVILELANECLDLGRLKEGLAMVDQLKEAKHPPVVAVILEYMDARLLFCKADWAAAQKALEKVRPDLARYPEYQKRTDFWIGCCCHQSSNQDKELEAYRRAIAIDPNYAEAHVGLADVYQARGNINNAIEELEHVIAHGASGAVWIQLVQMLIDKNLRMKPDKRDWVSVDKILDQAARHMPKSSRVVLLRAQILTSQNQILAAERLLQKYHDDDPKMVEYTTALCVLAVRQAQWDKAERLLNEATKVVGDQVSLRLAKAQYYVARYQGKAGPQLRTLAEKTDKFSAADKSQLWYGLLICSRQVSDVPQARKMADLVAQASPGDVHIQIIRFQLAIAAHDYGALDAILTQIEKISGRGAVWHYAKAATLSLTSDKKDKEWKARLTLAHQYLDLAHAEFPTWSQPPALDAGIYDQEGNVEMALKNYLSAISLGERNPEAIRRAMQLLNLKKRYHEASELFSELDEHQATLANSVYQFAIEDLLRDDKNAEAYALIHNLNITDPKSWKEQLWRGHVLNILGKRAQRDGRTGEAEQSLAEAENAYRLAVKLDGRQAEAHIALVEFLSGRTLPNGQPDPRQAQKTKEALVEAMSDLPARESHAAFARMYEAVRDKEHAELEYKAALDAFPDDPATIREVAFFYLRAKELNTATPLLQKLVDGKKTPLGDLVWARRQLALVVAARGGYVNLQNALKMIEENLASGELSAEDMRAKATFLGVDPRRVKRVEAAATLEKLLRSEELATPEDRFTLARLYLYLGDIAKFREQMRVLLAKDSKNIRFISVYISAELEHKEITEAEIWLGTLERLYPDAFVTAYHKADFLVRSNQPDQAMAVLETFVERPNVRPEETLAAQSTVADALEGFAGRLSDAHQTAAAERFLQKAEQLFRIYVGQRPEDSMLLVGFLARRGRTQEALDFMDKTWTGCSDVAVTQALEALVASKPSVHEQSGHIDNLIEDALKKFVIEDPPKTKKFHRSAPLLLIRAKSAAEQDNYPAAEGYYREILKNDPYNAAVLNNLAMVLAAQNAKLDEALTIINKAMDVAGPMSSMLDTRAVVYLARKDPEKALADLELVLADDSQPDRLLHQARAYYLKGERDRAADVLAQARKAGLKASKLEPYERPIYERLREDLR